MNTNSYMACQQAWGMNDVITWGRAMTGCWPLAKRPSWHSPSECSGHVSSQISTSFHLLFQNCLSWVPDEVCLFCKACLLPLRPLFSTSGKSTSWSRLSCQSLRLSIELPADPGKECFWARLGAGLRGCMNTWAALEMIFSATLSPIIKLCAMVGWGLSSESSLREPCIHSAESSMSSKTVLFAENWSSSLSAIVSSLWCIAEDAVAKESSVAACSKEFSSFFSLPLFPMTLCKERQYMTVHTRWSLLNLATYRFGQFFTTSTQNIASCVVYKIDTRSPVKCMKSHSVIYFCQRLTPADSVSSCSPSQISSVHAQY